jgi:NhaP-type Na+/H+ or K+/H+ antiporter
MNEQLAILAVFVFFYSVLAGRIERTVLSGPIIFVSAGFLCGPVVLGWFPAEPPDGSLRMLADLTLALFLFTDAANANRRTLEHSIGIPARLLMLGLPLTLLLGFLLAMVLFDTLSLPECAILAVMLAATDAALGKAVITHPQVPDRLREALNVESGLNDGFCVPLLLAMIALEFDEEGITGSGYALELLVRELGIGLGVGLVVAIGGAFVIRWATRRGWLNPIWSQVSSMALALCAFALAQSLHGSGYIAAFTAGMAFGWLVRERVAELVHSTEGIADILALLTWFLFGCAVIGQVFMQFSWQAVLYAVLSLTLVRMTAVYVAMIGSGEPPRVRLFLGWFGPRGLASIVFAIIVLDAGVPHAREMALIVVCTVFISLVMHGVTANPLARRIG